MFVKPGDVVELTSNIACVGKKGDIVNVYSGHRSYGFGKTKEELTALVGTVFGGTIANHPEVIKYLRLVNAKVKYKTKRPWD